MQFFAIPICPMTFKRPHHFIHLIACINKKFLSNIHVIHVSSEGCAKNPKNPKNPQSAARQQFSRILFCCFCGSRSDLPIRGLHPGLPGLPELPERSGAATLFVSLLSYAFIITSQVAKILSMSKFLYECPFSLSNIEHYFWMKLQMMELMENLVPQGFDLFLLSP